MIKRIFLFLDNLVNGDKSLPGLATGIDCPEDRNVNVPTPTMMLDGAAQDAIAIAIASRQQRYAAAIERLSDAGRADWPPVYADPFPGLSGAVPEIDAANLSTEILGGAVAHHGALLIRGLFSAEQVADTRAVQDRMKAASAINEPDGSGWYIPFAGKSKFEMALRRRAESRGGNWLADSPLGLSQVIQHLTTVGVVGAINEHFQERPALSLQKSTLRTVQPEPANTGWHQDGSFLGDDVRSMNVWVALSPCGGLLPASGLELIPRRFEEILPVDTALGVASISLEMIDDIKKRYTSVIPEFAAGDALMFDEHLLHRTSLEPGVKDVRYALECWFFAPSHSTSSYVPFLA